MKVLSVGGALVIAVVMLAAGIFVSGVAQASHNFSDVLTGVFYHNAVEWVFNRGITAGCAPGLYCPDAAVTRGQMAVFLRALGNVVTPQVILAESFGTGVDLDADPVVCATVDYSPSHAQRILARGWLSLLSGGAMNTRILLVSSTNAGTTWNLMPAEGGSNGIPNAGQSVAGFWSTATGFAYQDLAPGTTYRFGVRVSRSLTVGGTADATNHECELFGEIINRNPGTSPLAPPPGPERRVP